MSKESELICYLCGNPIERNPKDNNMMQSMDHVPPKQFFPKEIRKTEKLNLQLIPSHKKCNGDYKSDEEYFYHCMYPAVANVNPNMAKIMYEDLLRRSQKTQTQIIARKLLQNFKRVTDGGIHLPPGIVQTSIDYTRVQRVALKIARGLIYSETGKYMPLKNAKDSRLCLKEDEVPELYNLSFKASTIKGVYPKVFSYKYFEFDNHHLLSMFYWESFICCTLFESPV